MTSNDLDAYELPLVTVDIVVLALREGVLKVLLARRPSKPHAGKWALPGGFVHAQEDLSLEAAAQRVLAQKTGMRLRHLEQVGSVGGPRRDPRRWSLSVVHLALLSDAERSDTPVPGLRWVPVDALPSLAFDHADLIQRALARVRNKASYSSLPALLLPEVFTLPDLERVYSQVLGVPLNSAAFRRKIDAQGLIEPTGEAVQAKRGRPAALYRLCADALADFGRVVVLPDRRRGG